MNFRNNKHFLHQLKLYRRQHLKKELTTKFSTVMYHIYYIEERRKAINGTG